MNVSIDSDYCIVGFFCYPNFCSFVLKPKTKPTKLRKHMVLMGMVLMGVVLPQNENIKLTKLDSPYPK